MYLLPPLFYVGYKWLNDWNSINSRKMCACVIVEMDRYNIRLSKIDSRPSSSRGSCYEWVSNWNYVQPATVQERLQWDFVVISLSCILCWAKYSLLCGACAECARDDDDEAGEFPTIHFALSIGIIMDIVGGWVHQGDWYLSIRCCCCLIVIGCLGASDRDRSLIDCTSNLEEMNMATVIIIIKNR